MIWHTLEGGILCLGTNESRFANFHYSTEIQLEQPIHLPLAVEHIKLIGSYPEDWHQDENIGSRIDQAAKILFANEKCSNTRIKDSNQMNEDSLNKAIKIVKEQLSNYQEAGLTQVSAWL